MDTKRLQAGEDWRQVIDEAIIKDAFALVVIMTPEAKASEYVTYEWSCTHGAGVPIIPIMLKTTSIVEGMRMCDLAVRALMRIRSPQAIETSD